MPSREKSGKADFLADTSILAMLRQDLLVRIASVLLRVCR